MDYATQNRLVEALEKIAIELKIQNDITLCQSGDLTAMETVNTLRYGPAKKEAA